VAAGKHMSHASIAVPT